MHVLQRAPERHVRAVPGVGLSLSRGAGVAEWCGVCERERLDDIEFAVAEAKLASPRMFDNDDSFQRAEGFANLVSFLWHVASGPSRIRQARRAAMRAFAGKSLGEIAAWRATNVRHEK